MTDTKATMNARYGDGSDHPCCPDCGRCITCGDCAKFGCGKSAAGPDAQPTQTIQCLSGGDTLTEREVPIHDAQPTPRTDALREGIAARDKLRTFLVPEDLRDALDLCEELELALAAKEAELAVAEEREVKAWECADEWKKKTVAAEASLAEAKQRIEIEESLLCECHTKWVEDADPNECKLLCAAIESALAAQKERKS